MEPTPRPQLILGVMILVVGPARSLLLLPPSLLLSLSSSRAIGGHCVYLVADTKSAIIRKPFAEEAQYRVLDLELDRSGRLLTRRGCPTPISSRRLAYLRNTGTSSCREFVADPPPESRSSIVSSR